MDSGKFSSAAVNRVLKDTGQNQGISRVQVLQSSVSRAGNRIKLAGSENG
jgi:hypothetical protein